MILLTDETGLTRNIYFPKVITLKSHKKKIRTIVKIQPLEMDNEVEAWWHIQCMDVADIRSGRRRNAAQTDYTVPLHEEEAEATVEEHANKLKVTAINEVERLIIWSFKDRNV